MRQLNSLTLDKIEKYNLDFQKEYGKSPSYRQIMNALNLKSVSLVQKYILALEKEGRITRTSIGNIAMLPQLKPSGVTMTPLLGEIACGSPNIGVENIEESYALPKALFGEGDLFMLHTFGDSMIDIGIEENDLIVLKKQDTARDGDIVVALVDGNTTLKRLYHKDNKIVLHPENKTMEDIIVDTCDIQGVLVSCIKMYR